MSPPNSAFCFSFQIIRTASGLIPPYQKFRSSTHKFQAGVSFVVSNKISLGADYKGIRSQILNTTPLPNFNNVYQMLQREVARRQVMHSKTEISKESREKMACVAQADFVKGDQKNLSTNKPPNANFNYQKGRNKFRCTHCKRSGHTREKCWELVGRPTRDKATSSTNLDSANFVTKDDLEKFFQKFAKTNLISSQPVSNSEGCDISGLCDETGDW
ncbi:uncharacterized protein LOC126410534 [Nymphaea colorata]|uniref:uncharacterized protein LOC126410534 n=1 Tax=Nymphaea colorata TaxID=210225 RepID=UPI00214E472B|nr:uncharacterized protein LOC126410534 [Nymphaea colorata]